MQSIYAIGDVHGRDHLLEQMHARIEFDPHRSTGKPLVIHLGDYIDGGPNSDLVMDRLMRGSSAFDSVCLLGNHEALMLACLDTDDRDVWWSWRSNGGDATLRALGISGRAGNDPRALGEALGARRIDWLRGLPLYYRTPTHLFVHAGIVPGVPLEAQHAKDMLWIRSRFLDSDVDHGFVVVHGHTQTFAPELLPNRIGIDTGACRPKTLTAVALFLGSAPRFIQVSE